MCGPLVLRLPLSLLSHFTWKTRTFNNQIKARKQEDERKTVQTVDSKDDYKSDIDAAVFISCLSRACCFSVCCVCSESDWKSLVR